MKDINIKTDRCDDCGEHALGTEILAPAGDGEWMPVLFTCKHCDSRVFESAARNDIDSWLSGDLLF